MSDKSSIWRVFDAACRDSKSHNEPNSEAFYRHSKELSTFFEASHFSPIYEACALDFLKKYDDEQKPGSDNTNFTYDVLNANFTKEEIEITIDHMKCNESPGIDGIPAEILNACKDNLSCYIALILNYVVKKQDFPEKWSIGIRSAIHKAGVKTNVDNYRCVTIWPIVEKFFKTALYRRLSVVNELLGEVDPYNGGFSDRDSFNR